MHVSRNPSDRNSGPAGRWSRLVLPISAVVLLVLLAIGVTWVATARPGPTVRMPDGSRLRLVAVTVGPHHEAFAGTLLEEWLWRLSRKVPPPSALYIRLIRRRARVPLVFWTEQLPRGYRPELPFPWARGSGRGGWVTGMHGVPSVVRIIEETGRAQQGRGEGFSWNQSGAFLAPTAAVWLPRRSPTLRLQFLSYDRNGEVRPLAEFRVRNPLFRDYPQWTPSTLPAAAKPGQVPFTLEECRFRDYTTSARHPSYPAQRTEVRLAGRIRSTAEKGTWRIAGVQAADATGNQWDLTLTGAGRDPDGRIWATADFPGHSWSGERAYRITAVLTRLPIPAQTRMRWLGPEMSSRSLARLLPRPDNEVILMPRYARGVRSPAATQDPTGQVSGTLVTNASSEYERRRLAVPWTSGFRVNLSARDQNARIAVRGITDASGRDVAFRLSGFWHLGTGQFVSFRLPRVPTPLRVRVGVYVNRKVEWTVSGTDASDLSRRKGTPVAAGSAER